MSHFTVLVIGEDVDGQLAPFQENNMGDCPKEYLEFNDVEEEYKEDYENGSTEMYEKPDGSYEYSWNLSEEEKQTLKKVDLPYKEKYKSFEDFIESYEGYSKDEETGKYGYWENPNRKWDWYKEGGRWSGLLRVKEEAQDKYDGCTHVDQIYKGDLDLTPDKSIYDKSARFWELYIDGEEPKNEDEKDMVKYSFYKKEYYTNRFKTKENYAKIQASLGTFAVLKDGEWFEKGEMGWFGCSSETHEESQAWDESFVEKWIQDLPDDTLLTVVDCHI